MDEINRLSDMIEKLADSLQQAEKDHIARTELAGLSPTQLNYIDLIHHQDNPSLSECAAKLGVSKPSVTAAVDRLAAQGLVERVRSDDDRRSSHLHLTKEGKKIARIHDEFHLEFTKKKFGRLGGDDLRKIAALLAKAFGRSHTIVR